MFIELILLDILADTFLEKKKMGSWRNRVLGLLILTVIMSCYVMLFEKIVILKLFFDFLLICAYLMCFYQTTLKEVFFIYVFQYSVVSCIDCSALLGYNYVYGNSGNIVVYYLMWLLVRAVSYTHLIIEEAVSYGIITWGGGGDFPRNVMTSPLAGVEQGEYFDVMPYVKATADYLLTLINRVKICLLYTSHPPVKVELVKL